MKKALEVNFDGLVGNTHNYAGLSFGNVASHSHKGQVSSPKLAALQGLAKMKSLVDMGLVQGILPPHIRPFIPFLRRIGFSGKPETVLEQVASYPQYLNAACSASNMWVANAATVTPSADTADGRVHFTPANLTSMLHRSIEYPQTAQALQSIFANPHYFTHHPALQALIHSDEGAANHTRFCQEYGDKGVHLFVYGKSVFGNEPQPQTFPARQTRESFEAIARLHQISPDHCVFALQNPAVIDAGVFHNDVISVGNANVLFTHEKAFADSECVYGQLREKMGEHFEIIEVPDAMVSVDDAVSSYLFNSQLVNTDGGMRLIAPNHCETNQAVSRYLNHVVMDANSIVGVDYFDVKQSMANGGGPACLRLRVVLTAEELANISGRVIMDDSLYVDLTQWVKRHYRERLHVNELADVALLTESLVALEDLQNLLELPNLYDFTDFL